MLKYKIDPKRNRLRGYPIFHSLYLPRWTWLSEYSVSLINTERAMTRCPAQVTDHLPFTYEVYVLDAGSYQATIMEYGGHTNLARATPTILRLRGFLRRQT
jgi:hypothetical protein